MFRLALAVVLGLSVNPAIAQEDTSKRFYTMQGCDQWEKMAAVTGKYNEEILFIGDIRQFHQSGQPYNGGMLFSVNQDTGTWSLISLWPDGTACMVGSGENFSPYLSPKEDDM